MAKKKIKNKEHKKNEAFSPDMELITHEYSTYYQDLKNGELLEVGEEDTSYIWYDTKAVFYPVYKSKVIYDIAKEQKIHPIIIGILKIIRALEKIKCDTRKRLREITKLDSEIFESILADLEIKGMIKKENENLFLSTQGLEALKQESEIVKESTSAFVLSCGIFGDILEAGKGNKDVYSLDKADKEGIELKPKSSKRLRNEALSEFFNEEETLTLNQMLREGLKGLDDKEASKETQEGEEGKKKTKSCEIVDIVEIGDCRKFYQKYICLFYKNKSDDEKILVINEKYKIDTGATRLFDRLIDTSSFEAQNTKGYKENKKKFREMTKEVIEEKESIDLAHSKTISVSEHKKYFLHILKNAKKAVYIQSPWVRFDILKLYKEPLESALQRGVKIYIKYGLKPRNRFDKVGIDKEAREYLSSLKPRGLYLQEGNDHSKILICDDSVMIMGSFNWLSFGGKAKDKEELRGESSTINTNKTEIEKFIKNIMGQN